jgi:hypothetical protein
LGLDKEYEPGGAFYRDRDEVGCHLGSRPMREQLLEVECLKCGALPMSWCDRRGDRGYLSTARGRRLLAEGTPDSHQERKWTWQGHDPAEFAELRERERAGRLRAHEGNTDMADVTVINAVVEGVSCPVHGAERGSRCPGEPGVCKPRARKWILARGQRIVRRKQRASGRRKDRAA